MSRLKDQIKRHEAQRLKPYQDTVGKTSIGYGRNLDDVGISVLEAEMLLDHDIERAVRGLDRELPWWRDLDELRQEALIEMAFNLGIGGLLTFHFMLCALKDGRYGDAAAEALDSKWHRQVGRRARVIADMLRYGGAYAISTPTA